VERVRAAVDAGRLAEPVVVVLEGAARGGVDEGIADGVSVLHAPGGGDDMLVSVATDAVGDVTLVTADRELRRRAEAVGAGVAGPGWLLDVLDG
jgi:rRNA-processing protein FCF1